MSPVVTSLSAVAPEAVVLTAAATAAATTQDPPSSSAAILNVFTPTYTCLPYDMPNTNTNTHAHTANTQAKAYLLLSRRPLTQHGNIQLKNCRT